MTKTQSDAYVCGLIPEQTDACFFSQHLCAYAFARKLIHGKRVLEIGFGEGYGCAYLAETASEVIGIDAAAGNIPRAQIKYAHSNLQFLCMEGAALQFPESSFDAVCSFQVIEHIPQSQLMRHLCEVFRVLRQDGIYCLSTLNLDHNMKPGKQYEKLCYHEKEFTGSELRQLLSGAFPCVELHGLYVTRTQAFYRRLKKWGLEKLGPSCLNPIARFYAHMSVDAFETRPSVSAAALDIIAVCRKQ